MCGICGFIDFKSETDSTLLSSMVSTLHHRGPDDNGVSVYLTNNASVGLGHSRLSILDLSPAGHQPMNYEQFCIVLNGEIYNFKELKKDLLLLGHVFNSESDTEVVLHSFSQWGTNCVSKFIGMFVFVILNKMTNELTIVRDRAGVKPLYYYWNDGLFLFSSELKAFHKHNRFIKKININALHLYFDFGYIPSPYCIYEYCQKLNPGHILSFRISENKFETIKYWNVKDYYCFPDLNISYEEAQQEMERILLSAFEYRMVSDVPVGVFLSGGYDSTAIASMLQSNKQKKIKTFTIGFEEGNNEAPFAKQIANFIGSDHTEYYCKTKEAQEIIPDLPYYYDEPFSDSSAIPTTLVSKVARKSVTVALSGDGGDEIFAGYITYGTLKRDLRIIGLIPSSLRRLFSRFTKVSKLIIPVNRMNIRNKLEVFSDILDNNEDQSLQILFKSYGTLSKSEMQCLFDGNNHNQNTVYDDDFKNFKDNLSISLAIDYMMYMQNDILTKVDRATMSVSLEGREPLLDHRILEFAAQLPSDFKLGRTSKMILKDIVHKYVPEKLMNRSKTGFTVPIYSWLKNDLSYLLEEYLNVSCITKAGLLEPAYVQNLKRDFLAGQLYDPTIIWRLLQFQMWYNKWIENSY